MRSYQILLFAQIVWAVCCSATSAQVFSAPNSAGNKFGSLASLDASQTVRIDSNAFLVNTQNRVVASALQAPSGSISKLDLKAPGKARKEYEKGYRLLMKKDLQAAIEHLTKSVEIYPSFVAARNALGTAYLNLGKGQQARDQFASAVALDDHLPNSYLNLGCSQLALNQFADAEKSLKKASSIAPMDLQLLTALTYAEFVNHDYPSVIATVRQVHDRKHAGAAVVHYFAAGALEAQNDPVGAQREMETLLAEDSKSPSTAQFQQILEELKAEQVGNGRRRARPPDPRLLDSSANSFVGPTAEEVSRHAQQMLQDKREEIQIAEAEAAADPGCVSCRMDTPMPSAIGSSVPGSQRTNLTSSAAMLRVAVDEVALFFSVTDHGKSVPNLAASEIRILDDRQPPQAITAFHNESQLPLRLGLIIDISNSVSDRFRFEQDAASKFLQTLVTNKDDLAFVVGVNNSVLVVQDFTSDQELTSRAIGQLAPGGGTSLWDAVAFAAGKLAGRPEQQPVARILVVISDGMDNSSSTSLKEAIRRAQQGEVAIYAVNTRDRTERDTRELVGDHALRTLAELTGGSALVPGSIHALDGSLAALQQVIRGRYLISYKPSSFERDGRYRSVDLRAEKDGRKLTIYARKGYFASTEDSSSSSQE